MTDSLTTSDLITRALPTELITKTFEYCVFNEWPRSLALNRLRQVCKAWATVVDSTPSLWGAISSEEPRSVYLRSLIKSQASPLRVKYFYADHYEKKPSLTPSFFSTACDNAHRWSSFSFTIRGTSYSYLEDSFRQLNTLAVPVLKELNVGVLAEGFRWDAVEDLFGGVAPRLRYLSLSGVYIPWNSGLLRNLRTLSLFYRQVQRGPSTHDITLVLANAPTLVDIYLHYNSSGYGSIPSDLTPLNLPSLETLHFVLDWPTLTHLTKRIRIPNCLRFVCGSYDMRPITQSIFSSNTDHIAPIIQRGISSSTWQRMNISADGTRFEYEARIDQDDRDSTIVKIELRDPAQEEGQKPESMRWIVDNISWDSARPLPLSLAISLLGVVPFNSDILYPMMSKLSDQVQSHGLTLFGSSGIPASLLSYLSEPYESVGVSRWWFPNLCELKNHLYGGSSRSWSDRTSARQSHDDRSWRHP